MSGNKRYWEKWEVNIRLLRKTENLPVYKASVNIKYSNLFEISLKLAVA